MRLVDWFAAFAGSGIVGWALNLKEPQEWILFLVAWIFIGTLIYQYTGIQTHAGYYLGLEKDPQYPDLFVRQ